jgi:aldehyde dehydrogenase (NAD+)
VIVGDVRMLIDRKLVEGMSGKRFANINPATEEVLGEVADADATDMARAIAAARRAYDDTERVDEVGTPLMLTYGAHLDWPLDLETKSIAWAS